MSDGGTGRGARVRVVFVVLVSALVVVGWVRAPAAATSTSQAPSRVGSAATSAGTITGTSGQAVVPNFVMDKVHPRQVLVDDTVTWTWTAPADGRYAFDSHGSEMDTVLTVRPKGARAGQRHTTKSDDAGDVTTSAVTIAASEGQRFEITVRAKDDQTGLVTLSWHQEADAAQTQQRRAAPTPSSFAAIPTSTNTGEKPQSKAWRHDGRWWVVLASADIAPAGTWLWTLEGDRWTPELRLSSHTDVRADVAAEGAVAHVLLHGPSTSLVSLEYDGSGYQPWSQRTDATDVSMPGSETATLTIDTTGRMWTAYDSGSTVQVRHSDAPYTSFSSPTTLASGTTEDDIAAVTSLADGRVGVMWSNQSTRRFGFRTHLDGGSPSSWTSDEVPAAGSATSVGGGMADDHINMALAPDGSLYAAVKTSYDRASQPVIALLVRQPNGTWEPLHEVARHGTRPIVLIDEGDDTVKVLFTDTERLDDIDMRVSPRSEINFSAGETEVLSGDFNNVTSTKSTIDGPGLVLAASTGTVSHAVLGGGDDPGPDPDPEPVAEGPVGLWGFGEGAGSVVGDGSGSGNDGAVVGSPSWVAGVKGSGVELGGSDYVVVPDAPSLGPSGPMTVAAWIRPDRVGTQYVLKKAAQGSTDGYEVGLSSGGKAFVRLNQASSGNTYRVDSTSSYPVDGQTWMHVAGVFDGSRVRLYIDGVEQGSVPGPGSAALNSLDLVLGAGEGGYRPLSGGLDEAGVYSGALTPAEIADLATAS